MDFRYFWCCPRGSQNRVKTHVKNKQKIEGFLKSFWGRSVTVLGGPNPLEFIIPGEAFSTLWSTLVLEAPRTRFFRMFRGVEVDLGRFLEGVGRTFRLLDIDFQRFLSRLLDIDFQRFLCRLGRQHWFQMVTFSHAKTVSLCVSVCLDLLPMQAKVSCV